MKAHGYVNHSPEDQLEPISFERREPRAENVIWKEMVTDEEYYRNRQPKGKAAADTGALTAKQRSIIPIAAYTASGDLESLEDAIRAGLDAGLSVNEIKEIQIHLYAYAGFPRALNGLATLMAVLDERKAKGITDPIGKAASSLPADKSRLEFGKEVQTRLAGKPVSGPLFDFAPDINQLLQSHLFGDLFGRNILDYQSREIATVSALSSIEGVDAQLKAHIRIAANVGLTEAQLRALAAVLNETWAHGKEVGPNRRFKYDMPRRCPSVDDHVFPL